jgi:ABC-2 type transport system permease protein
VTGTALWRGLLAELLWAVFFIILARVLFRVGLRRYSAFGG